MRYIVMAMITVMICLDLSTAHSEMPDERESLRGLPGVQVVIEDISPDAQADGLSKEAIRADVELILRASGIRVLTQSESSATHSKPYLYVGIGTLKSKTELNYAVNVNIALIQQVSLAHSPEHLMGAATYQIPAVGIYSTHSLKDLISNVVVPGVKTFANDFLAVNPR